MKRILLVLFLSTLVWSCTTKQNVKGTYSAATENALVKSITFDGEVVSYGGTFGKFMPTSSYEIKNEKIYVEAPEGILVFKIINSTKIQCETSILKDDIFIKQ